MDLDTEINTAFNPHHTYGYYLLISEPNADDVAIAEATARLQEQIDQLVPREYQAQIIWEVNPEHHQYDPLTDTYVTCTVVAWRYTP